MVRSPPSSGSAYLGKLEEAGADADDRRIIEQELQQPRSLDALLRDVTDPETAEQVYLGVGNGD